MVLTEDSAESEQGTSAPVQTVPRPTIPPDRRLTPTPVPATFIRMEQVFSGESEGIICESAEIGYGGTSSCKVAYQVPVNYDQDKIIMNLWKRVNNLNSM